eukprot:COSAG04_NODE_15313_length_536_cov_0.695652_1_plen_34_part_01
MWRALRVLYGDPLQHGLQRRAHRGRRLRVAPSAL